MCRTAAFLIVVLSVAGAACDGLTFEDPSLIRISATVDRTSIQPGDTVRVTITAENTTRGVVRFQLSSGCLLLYEVRDFDGDVIVPPGGAWLCPAVITDVEFAPREIVQQQVVWTGERERAVRNPEGRIVIAHEPVPPGPYEIVAYMGQWKLVVSRPIVVQVRDVS
jgi:hypothetical protein